MLWTLQIHFKFEFKALCGILKHKSFTLWYEDAFLNFYTFFFYKNTWFEFQPAVSYFAVYFQPKVFLILFHIFLSNFLSIVVSRHNTYLIIAI